MLQQLIAKTTVETHQWSESNDHIIAKVTSANQNITESSAALAELSANMESVSNNSNNISSILETVKEQVVGIQKDSIAGSDLIVNVVAESKETKDHIESMTNVTQQKIKEITELLNKSLEDSEKVSQINYFT